MSMTAFAPITLCGFVPRSDLELEIKTD